MPESASKKAVPADAHLWKEHAPAGTRSRTGDISKKLLKYEQAKVSSLDIRDYIVKFIDSFSSDQQLVLSTAAKRMTDCGNYLQFYHYFLLNKNRLKKAQFCKQHLLCPVCAIRRAVVNNYAYVSKFEIMKLVYPELRYSLLTLTVRHNKNDSLHDVEKKLRSAFASATRRIQNSRAGKSSSVFGAFLGWVAVTEVTNSSENGFHPHYHVLVLHDQDISVDDLRREWLEITGDSDQITLTHGQNPDDPGKDFAEIFKYTCKFSSMCNSDIVETYLTLKGRKLIFSGGIFRGVKVPEDLLDSEFYDSPYVDLFYQFSRKSGYNLKHSKVVHPSEVAFQWFSYEYDQTPASEWKYQFEGDAEGNAFMREIYGIKLERKTFQYALSLVDLSAPVNVWRPTEAQIVSYKQDSLGFVDSFGSTEPVVHRTIVDYVKETYYEKAAV